MDHFLPVVDSIGLRSPDVPVGGHFTRHQHIVVQFIIQWTKLLPHDINPAPHRIAAQLHALPGADFRLSIQRRVLCELRHDNSRQQTRAGVTALNEL